MYYEIDEINSKLQCSFCKQRIDIPRLLPCGYTICNKCAQNILVNQPVDQQLMQIDINQQTPVESKTKIEFYCSACSQVHKITENGLPIQKLVLELLNLKSIKVYRSGVYQTFEDLLRQVNGNLLAFKSLISNSEGCLHGYCESLRNSVMHAAQRRIDELNSIKEKLFNEVNLYEEKCSGHFKSKFIDYQRLNDLVLRSEKCIFEWNSYFKKADSSEELIENLLNSAKLLNNELVDSVQNFEKNLFNSLKMCFNECNESLSNDCIGKIEYKAI